MSPSNVGVGSGNGGGSSEAFDDADHSILVPLEFSGGTTRVLTDPEEIKEIQCHEMERYYNRKYVRGFVHL